MDRLTMDTTGKTGIGLTFDLDVSCANMDTAERLQALIIRFGKLEKAVSDADGKYDLDRLRALAEADRDGRVVVMGEPVNISYKSERIADEGKTLKPLDKSALLQKRGMAVLVASLDGKPMLYGMDRVAAVIDTVPIYGESHTGIVAIYGRGLTLGDSDYGITWVAYDYNSSENPNCSVSHFVGVNTMDGKDDNE